MFTSLHGSDCLLLKSDSHDLNKSGFLFLNSRLFFTIMRVEGSDDEYELSLTESSVPGEHLDSQAIAITGPALSSLTGRITRSQRAAVAPAENSQHTFLAGGGPAPRNLDTIMACTSADTVQNPGSFGSFHINLQHLMRIWSAYIQRMK